MQANPFASPAESQPTAALPAVSRQPHAFGVMGALVVLLSLVLGHLLALLNQPEFADYLRDYLPTLLPGWACAVLLGGLASTLLVRAYQERHAVLFNHPGRLLAGIAAAILLADLLYGALSGFLLGGLYRWLSEHSELLAVYQPLVFEPLGLLAFALTNLLPLWLGLRLGAQRPATPAHVPRLEAVALLALGVLLLSLKALVLLANQMLHGYIGGLPLTLAYLTPLICAALVFASAWAALPARLARLKVGQLLLTALAIFIVWLLAQLLVAALLVLSAFGGSDVLLEPLPLTIAGVAVLALLWPLTLLGLRWIYRAEAA